MSDDYPLRLRAYRGQLTIHAAQRSTTRGMVRTACGQPGMVEMTELDGPEREVTCRRCKAVQGAPEEQQ